MKNKQGIVSFIRPEILGMKGYVPGLQKNNPDIIKLNSNENPFPPSKKVILAIENALKNIPLEKYPDPKSAKLREAIAKKHNVKDTMVLVGNGSDEVLSILFRSLLNKDDIVLLPDPTYSLYPILTDIIGAKIQNIPLRSDWGIDFTKMNEATLTKTNQLSILVHPNAPTGIVEKKEDVLGFVKNSPSPVLIDEAYVDFGSESYAPYVGADEYPMLMTCGTFSKSYSLAGFRVGWIIAPESIIVQLDKIRDSYNISWISQIAALTALEDTKEFNSRISQIIDLRKYLRQELEKVGFECLTGQGNFLFCKTPFESAQKALSLYTFLENKGILIRYFKTQSLDQYLRISIGRTEHMEHLVSLCQEWVLANSKIG